MIVRIAIGAALAVLLAATPALAQSSDAELCAAMAANPFDPATPAGTGVDQEDIDIDLAKAACTSAVAAPDATPRTHYLLGRVLDQAEDFDGAFEQYTIAADGGLSIAINALGMAHEFGEGVEADPAKALALYQQAYDLDGLPVAAANIGYAYSYGVGVEVDYAKAMSFYEIAAAGNVGWAINEIGRMYENGDGVEVDYLKAADYYKAAFKAGESVGASNMGLLYESGLGVPQDYAEAVKYYQLAADEGNGYGLSNLADMYVNGRGGLTASGEKAIELYLKAAEAGNAEGWSGAASVYNGGILVPQDFAKSRELNQKAIESGDSYAAAAGNNGLAWSYVLENTNLEEAVALAEKAIEGDPEFGGYHDTLAWALHLQGKSAEALPHAQRAVELNDGDAHLDAHLGDILLALGKPDEARIAYEEAVKNEANYALDATVDMDAIKAWLAAN